MARLHCVDPLLERRAEVATKRCTCCKTVKPISDFYPKRTGSKHYSTCKECGKAKSRQAYADNRDKRLAYSRRYIETPEGQAVQKRSALKFRYGITLEAYAALLAVQEGRCAICRADQPGGRWNKNFFVDHDHRTKMVRGLLCHNCNAGVGHFFEDPVRMQRAIEYVLKHQQPARGRGDAIDET